jgi:hypothetical protein
MTRKKGDPNGAANRTTTTPLSARVGAGEGGLLRRPILLHPLLQMKVARSESTAGTTTRTRRGRKKRKKRRRRKRRRTRRSGRRGEKRRSERRWARRALASSGDTTASCARPTCSLRTPYYKLPT